MIKYRDKGDKMHRLSQMFRPITATPFVFGDGHIEVEPCEVLKPYIRCFWGHKVPVRCSVHKEDVVVPDSCMDIIFNINYTDNKIESIFCGVTDKMFKTPEWESKEEVISVFAIRFYTWSAILFSDEDMKEVRNGMYEVEHYYSKIKKAIEPYLFEISTLEGRILLAERVLLDNLHLDRANPVVNEMIFEGMKHKGNIKITELTDKVHMSSRQLERILKNNVGLSPKQMMALMRYQYLWNDIVRRGYSSVLDYSNYYGYTDQSHLLRDFKKYHGMLPGEAYEFSRRGLGGSQAILEDKK